MIKTVTTETAPRVPFSLDGRIMLSRPSCELIHLSLSPEQNIPRHVNDFDVAIFVLSGEVLLLTTPENLKLQQGMLAEIEGGIERGITNIGKVNAKLLILKMFR